MQHIAKNLVLFKAGWLACVLGAANELAWLGPLAVVLIAAEHLRTAKAPLNEVKLLVLAAAIGAVWESALVVTNVLDYGMSATFAPCSGATAGAGEFVSGMTSLPVIGIGSAVPLPALVIASKRFNGHAESVPLSLQRA